MRTANYPASAMLLAERTEASLLSLVDSTGQYVVPPAYVADIPRLTTGQVPVNLTQGTATDASDLFVGDFSNIAIGVRTQFEVKVLRERFADTAEVGFIAWLRADVQVTRPNAFSIVSGITG